MKKNLSFFVHCSVRRKSIPLSAFFDGLLTVFALTFGAESAIDERFVNLSLPYADKQHSSVWRRENERSS